MTRRATPREPTPRPSTPALHTSPRCEKCSSGAGLDIPGILPHGRKCHCMDAAWMLHGCCMDVACMPHECCMMSPLSPHVGGRAAGGKPDSFRETWDVPSGSTAPTPALLSEVGVGSYGRVREGMGLGSLLPLHAVTRVERRNCMPLRGLLLLSRSSYRDVARTVGNGPTVECPHVHAERCLAPRAADCPTPTRSRHADAPRPPSHSPPDRWQREAAQRGRVHVRLGRVPPRAMPPHVLSR